MPAAQPIENVDAARGALELGDFTRAEAICSQLIGKEPQNSAAWHVLGLARQKRGERDSAIEALAKATTLDRQVARYHHDLANALLDDGKIDRAITSFRRALRVDDGLAEAHNDLGTAYFQKGWHAEAEGCFRKAISLKPDHGIAHANLGAALRAQGRLSDSRRAFQRALGLRVRGLLPAFLRWPVRQQPPATAPDPALQEAVRRGVNQVGEALAAKRLDDALRLARDLESRHPDNPDAALMLALALEQSKDVQGALKCTRAAIEHKPERAEYHIVLARLLVKCGEHNAALEAALVALKLEPGSADIHATIAGVYHPWRNDLAELAARRAIELDPASHAGHGNLAAALWGQGRIDEAERHAREAIRLKPGQLAYRANLALIRKDQGHIDDARQMYRELLAEAPEDPKITLDLGTLANECEGDLEAARNWYRKSQQLSGEPRAFLSEALIDLLDGRYETAWDKYEARKRVSDQRYQHEIFASFPEWRGDAPPARRLLVYGEQGLGDEIMFASIFNEICRRVPRVALICDQRLGALFRRSFPAFEVIAEPRGSQGERARSLPDIDCAIAAGSLGRLFRRRAEDFPGHNGYLTPDPAKTADWKARLESLGPGTRIGISWIGGMQKTGRSRRSLSLAALRPVLETPGISWVSLQYTPCADEIAALGAAGGPRITEFPGATGDMDDLASLVAALDLVVSVCNTTVHVAGAVGKRVLVMAPFVPEWRYGIAGENMIWYPSVAVVRQQRYGDWSRVLEVIRERLLQRLG